MAATRKKTAAPKKSGKKTTPKTAAKKTGAKPKTAKPKTAKKPTPVKTRTVKLASGRKIARPAEYAGRSGSVRESDHRLASAVASALACTDGTGDALNRAPIGSVQIADVRHALRTGKSVSQSAAVKMTGASDWPELVGYADGRIGRRDLSENVGATLRSLAAKKTKSGKTLDQRKLNGRALAAAIVGLAVQSGAKLPTGKKNGATAPVVTAAKSK